MALAGEEARGAKLRVFFIPFFASGHIIPMTDLACLFAKRPGVEPTMVITPANAALIRPTLDHSASSGHTVQLLLYPFPSAAHLPSGIENLGSVSSDDTWKIHKAVDLSREAHDRIIREHTPDAIISDIPFWWTTAIAKDLGIPRITFHAVGVFPQCIMNNLVKNRVHDHVPTDSHPFTIPDLPGPCIKMVKSELPEFLKHRDHLTSAWDDLKKSQLESYGVVVNAFYELEHEYCVITTERLIAWESLVRRTVALCDEQGKAGRGGGESEAARENRERCMRWLGGKEAGSVLFVCFGSWCYFEDEQLREMALGLEASGMEFLWVVRGDHGEHVKTEWMSEGWEERVKGKGLVVRGWAPQAAILDHEAVGVFMTHCGWNSLLEGLGSGKPIADADAVFEQFVNERLVVEVLKVGVRVWDGFRSTFEKEKVVVPAEAIERAVRKFMEGSGEGEEMRKRAAEWVKIAGAAVAEGGSSHKDLNSLIDDLFILQHERKNGKHIE
ncbi:hypothetical protein J5N97_003052 [Dioscorea zingiberensis]|uniref:Glycosyltransferase n=1 Tax=Dioscorea zingiberensis TaxID=325984 RepID=A0A9D5D3H4_9LILI|nr:hypothetical protein J5N97_003052 [Dioscorea zingiberensis]